MAKSLAIRKEFDMAELGEIEQEVEREIREARRGPWTVTRYRVTRCWGGAEEGGWWFDWQDLDTETMSSGFDRWEDAIEFKAARQADEPKIQRFSVLGGPDWVWFLERYRGEEQTKQAPRYE